MKYVFTLVLTFLFLVTSHAQWARVNTAEYGPTSGVVTHKGNVFYFGWVGGEATVERSLDNGETWTDISSSFPEEVLGIYDHGDEIFVVTFGSGETYPVLVSTDGGIDWQQRSAITFAGGAVEQICGNGDLLYAITNRETLFKSEDRGATWTELTVPNENAQLYDIATNGEFVAAIALGLGAFVSTDAGTSWELINPNVVLGEVEALNGRIFATSTGVFALDGAGTEWMTMSEGIPGGGQTSTMSSPTSIGATIYVHERQIIGGVTGIYVSTDNGNNWDPLEMEGIPVSNFMSSTQIIAGSDGYLYSVYYGLLDPEARGLYRTEVEATSVKELGGAVPSAFTLEQNYPNPFNPATTIRYEIPQQSEVTLKVYSVLGNEIATLVDGVQAAGRYEAVFEARGLSSGIYFYRLEADGRISVRRMLLIK